MIIRIKEQTLFAQLCAKSLKSYRVAAVLGNSIHLWNVSRKDFLENTAWVVHELEHVRQFKRHGFFVFASMYLWEGAKKGYQNNRYEAEARAAEDAATTNDLLGITFI